MWSFHQKLTSSAPHLQMVPDYAARREEMKTLMNEAGGYSNLDDDSQYVAAAWFLIEDEKELTSQFLTSVQKNYALAQKTADELKAVADSQKSKVDNAQVEYDAAVLALDTATDPALLSARNSARADHETAQDVLEASQAELEAEMQTLQNLRESLSQAQFNLNQQIHDTSSLTTLRDDAQAALDADPTNTDLQADLAAAQQNLDDHLVLVAAVDAAESNVDAQILVVDQATAVRKTNLDEAEIKIQVLRQAQSLIDEVYHKKFAEEMAALEGEMEVLVAADPQDTEAIALKQAEIDAKQVELDHQNIMIAARDDMMAKQQILYAEQSVWQPLDHQSQIAQEKADALNMDQASWAMKAAVEKSKWALKYHTCMMTSRERRIAMTSVYLFSQFTKDECQVLYRQLGDKPELYVKTGLKGVNQGNAEEGLWDYLHSQAGTSFAGSGFLESGLVPSSGTLTEARDRILQILETGQ